MSKVTVTLEEHEARALCFSSDMGEMFMERASCRSIFPPGLSPREIAVQKVTAALERAEQPDHFEALGVPEFGRPTWDPRGVA
jgi:hypothetical protein